MKTSQTEAHIAIPPGLKARFGYMFAHPAFDGSIPKWWAPRFADLCEEIDTILGVDKRGFHWRQLKEKLGTSRYYWSLTPWDLSMHPITLIEAIRAAITAADADLSPRRAG